MSKMESENNFENPLYIVVLSLIIFLSLISLSFILYSAWLAPNYQLQTFESQKPSNNIAKLTLNTLESTNIIKTEDSTLSPKGFTLPFNINSDMNSNLPFTEFLNVYIPQYKADYFLDTTGDGIGDTEISITFARFGVWVLFSLHFTATTLVGSTLSSVEWNLTSQLPAIFGSKVLYNGNFLILNGTSDADLVSFQLNLADNSMKIIPKSVVYATNLTIINDQIFTYCLNNA